MGGAGDVGAGRAGGVAGGVAGGGCGGVGSTGGVVSRWGNSERALGIVEYKAGPFVMKYDRLCCSLKSGINCAIYRIIHFDVSLSLGQPLGTD